MGAFKWALDKAGYEKRDVSSKDPFLAEHLGARSASGAGSITPESATGIAAVHACVQLIAESMASLPLAPLRRLDNGGKAADTNHPLYSVLHDQANKIQTAMEFREQFIASCLLTGNGYARKVIDGRGNAVALEPLNSQHVRPVKLTNGRIRYEYQSPGSKAETLLQDEVLHLRYRSNDGVMGLSPIAIARQTLSTAKAQQDFETAFYNKGVQATGVLSFEDKYTPEQIIQLKGMVDRFSDDKSRVGSTLMLPGDMKYHRISMSMADAEFVAAKKISIDEVARIFRVPPPAIGILSDATYSNITEQARSLVMYTLRPWMVRIEQAMNASLLTDVTRRTHTIEHNAEGLLRGNQQERFESYRIASEWGWMNVNEIRQKENMSTIGDAGDIYRQPLNSKELGTGSSERNSE